VSQYILSPTAIRDLEEISDYYAVRSFATGERLLEEFNKKCRYLAQFPRIGRSYEHLQVGMRGLLFNNHIIFYQLLNDGIEILRVLRGDRDLDTLFDVDTPD
jgi:toxin ParE1/3/4